MTDGFSRFHPLVNFLFYVAVLGITMFQMQTGLILISLVFGAVYHFYLKRSGGLRYFVTVAIVFLLSALINPLFSHKGTTLLFYLFTGNPVTLESILYGVAAASVICSVLFWFSSLQVVMTEDKVMSVIGRFMPHVALLLTMVFRFVPKYIHHGRAVIQANQALGMEHGGWRSRLREQAEVFSITTTWALENSVDTADSMRARGYGTGRRTSYNHDRFQKRDVAAVLWILMLTAFVCVALGTGAAVTYYYPVYRIQGNLLVYITYTFLCATPIIVDVWEAFQWHRLRLKI